MASEITADGQVIAPLNVRKPAPILDIRDFQWRGTDTTHPQIAPVARVAAPEVKLFAQGVAAAAGAAPKASSVAVDEPVPDEKVLREQLDIDRPKEKRQPILKFPLDKFTGAYAGNGFNMIFRPRPFKRDPETNKPLEIFNIEDPKPNGLNDNILQLSLTTEQWTFGPTLGKIPNRGLFKQVDIDLTGLPYLQTVQDVTNLATGKGDKVDTNKANGIHLEPGVILLVPPSDSHQGTSIVRMASIPHGTTINAQGLAPDPNVKRSAKPDFTKHVIDTTPFTIGDPKNGRQTNPDFFPSMNADRVNEPLRIPGDLSKFSDKNGGTGRITTEIIKNPNKVLEKAIEGQVITDTITFSLSTALPKDDKDPSFASHVPGGGGTANITFLGPNAHTESVTNTWWVETVEYTVNVPGPLAEGETIKEVRPTMPPVSVPGDKTKKQPSLAPTPVFRITGPKGGVPTGTIVPLKVPGTQIQYSQTVNLNFGKLTWPHVSVATLVPVTPQPYQMTPEDLKRKS